MSSTVETPGRAGGRAAFAWPLAVLLAALALCWPAAWNGQPFFHYDTASYVRGADTAASMLLGDRFATPWTQAAPAAEVAGVADIAAQAAEAEVGGGRSIYYAALTYLGEAAGGFWLTVLLQGLAVALLVEVTLRALRLRSLAAYAGTIALLALLTPAPFFVSLLLPDIWAGIAVGATAALFAFGRGLPRRDIGLLWAMTAFAALAHNSVVLVLAALALLAGLLAWRLRPAGPDLRTGLAGAALAVLVGVSGTLLFNAAVDKTTGAPPVMPPFLTARVAADPAGMRYVRERCSVEAFEVCRYADRLPLAVDDFLWTRDPRLGVFQTVPAEARRALSREQARFALAVFAAYPAEQAAASLKNAAAQAVTLELEDFKPLARHTAGIAETLVEPHRSGFLRAAGARESWPFAAIEGLQAAAVLVALALLALAFGRGRWDDPRERQALLYAAAVLAAVLINAAVCGALSALHGRYVARTVWCVVLAAGLLAAVRLQAMAALSPGPRAAGLPASGA